ncbi:MAG: hypothetical protein ABIP97_09090 [Chthoniobacterales bacterium]
MLNKFLLLSILATLLCSCDSAPNYVHNLPQNADLVGTWILTKDAAESLRQIGTDLDGEHNLQLNADGTFVIVGMPNLFLSQTTNAKFYSATGKWHVDRANWYWQITLQFETLNQDNAMFFSFIPIENQNPPYSLHMIYGDRSDNFFYPFVRTDPSRVNIKR